MRLRKINTTSTAPETGFGTNVNASNQRFLNKDGSPNIARLGEPFFQFINIYHSLITMSWRKFNVIVLCFYFTVNLIFTAIYILLSPDKILGMLYTTKYEKFWEVFFFSAQTLTTVGYGRLNPSGISISTIAAVESLFGLLGFALATGLLYGRFSRPTAKIIYSDKALVAPYRHRDFEFKDMTAFMFRIANARRNQLIEIETQVIFSYNAEEDGRIQRRFQTLDLEISKASFLTLSWTIVHPITDKSPMFGLTLEDLDNLEAEFFISIKAVDDGYAQQVYSRSSYKSSEIVFNAKFIPAISQLPSGQTAVDLKKISSYNLLS